MSGETAIVYSYVPAISAELVSMGGDQPPWGGMIEGTLVMADVSGFTTMSERLAQSGPEGAERLTAIINQFFGQMLDAARECGGDTLTFGGDAILLLFRGVDHADRAVAAACGMLAETRRLPSFELPGGRVRLGMSVGAHSGQFLLALAGLPEERMQLFVLGEAATRAAEAEGLAKRAELIVSSETAGQLHRPWHLEHFEGWARASAPRGKLQGTGPIQVARLPQSLAPLLLSLTPPSVKEAVQQRRSPRESPPEHRRVSMVFIGVLGLNKILDEEGVEAAVAELQGYAVRVVGLAAKHGGFVVSTDIDSQGLKILLAFGAPLAHEYAVANAARFALELHRQVESASGRLRQCIGVNGGHVFAGDIGPGWRRQYTVMGDEVNIAARLMDHAEPGTILAARSWAKQVESQFCVEARPSLRVKGKAEEVPVCTLREELEAQLGADRWSTPFFGRKEELELVAQLWAEVGTGHGKALFVTGEPGVGKSRLLDEAVRKVIQGAPLLSASCQEHLRGIPFAPWVDILSRLLALDHEETASARTAVAVTALDRWTPDMTEFGSLLNPLLGLRLPASDVVSSLDVQSRRERLVELVIRLLTASCPPQGRVLLIENVHWADESSLALLDQLTEHIDRARLLLLVSTRTTDRPLKRPASATTLDLAELSPEDSLDLIRTVLQTPDLPEAVADAVHAKTRGNLLFLEEVIHSLEAPGVLAKILDSSSVARAVELATLAIPDRVQGLLMSRLDALPAEEREVLKVAAVVGQQFEQPVLEGLSSLPTETQALGPVLENMLRAALVIRATDDDAFRFRHTLLQEVAYESLPYAQRRKIHGEVAEFIENSTERPDHGVLVHHYRQAGDSQKVRVHAVRAAESSQAVYAFREALDYLSIALETVQAPTSGQAALRSRLEELTGDCLESLARHHEATESYMRARRRWALSSVQAAASAALADVAPLSDPEARAADLCRKIGVCLERQHSDYVRALRWLKKADDSLPPRRTALASQLQVTKGVIYFRLGRLEEALTHGERGLALARREGGEALQAYALAMLTNPLVALGLLQRSIEVSLEAVALYERAGDLAGQASGHGNLAACYQLVGNLRASLHHHEISLEINKRLSYHTGVSIIHNNIAEVLLQLGQTEEAIEHLEQVVDGWEERDMPPALVGFALVNLSKALLRQREQAKAAQALAEGHRLLGQAQARGLLIEADLQAVKLLLSENRFEEARTACQQVVKAAKEAGAKVGEAHALSLLGRAELLCHNPATAEEHLLNSVGLAKEIGADYERGLALLTLSELYAFASPADPHRYEAPLAEAIALFEGMGAEHDLLKARELRDRCSTMLSNS